MPRTYLVSAAHEWAFEKALCDRFGAFDNSVRPEGGGYVPELASDDLFADYGEWVATSPEGDSTNAVGIAFPDGSVLFWFDDTWSVTDPNLECVRGEWQLEPR